MVVGYECWGFYDFLNEMIDVLNVWVSFIYGLLFDDCVWSIVDGFKLSEYGCKEVIQVYSELWCLGLVKLFWEFVFMDWVVIGLGVVFLYLDCCFNFYQLFNGLIENFVIDCFVQ